MSKIPLIMDLIAGLLLAYDFFPKSGILLKLNNYIKDNIIKTDPTNVIQGRTIIFNIVVSFSIFLSMLAWAWYRSSIQTPGQNNGIWVEIGWFTMGSVVAWIFITLIAWILKKIKQESALLILGVVISTATLVFFSKQSYFSNIITPLVAFIFMCMLYPLAITLANIVRKVLLADRDKPYYVFAVMGLAIFVISKIIELAV